MISCRHIRLVCLTALGAALVAVSTASAALAPTDTATGTGALAGENGGFHNTADGFHALFSNSTGHDNTAVGSEALLSNSTASRNTALGLAALANNSTGEDNTAVGVTSMYLNTTGTHNTAVGEALDANTTGSDNTVSGWGAMEDNTTGAGNTALGAAAFGFNTTGSDNTALGHFAGVTQQFANANVSGSKNTFLGADAGPDGPSQLSDATAVGADAVVGESDALVLGRPPKLVGVPGHLVPSVVKVGIGTTTPQSQLQLGKPASSYGAYLQLPMITSSNPPPAADCNNSTFVGRLVVQYDQANAKTTLWSCSAAGAWTTLAMG